MVILNVDVNVSGMNSDVAVSLQGIHGHCVYLLYPRHCVIAWYYFPLAYACQETRLMGREWNQPWLSLDFDTYLPSQKAHQVSLCSVYVAGLGLVPELPHPIQCIEVRLLF